MPRSSHRGLKGHQGGVNSLSVHVAGSGGSLIAGCGDGELQVRRRKKKKKNG